MSATHESQPAPSAGENIFFSSSHSITLLHENISTRTFSLKKHTHSFIRFDKIVFFLSKTLIEILIYFISTYIYDYYDAFRIHKI